MTHHFAQRAVLVGFGDASLADPSDAPHGIDLAALAARTVVRYARYWAERKNTGSPTSPSCRG